MENNRSGRQRNSQLLDVAAGGAVEKANLQFIDELDGMKKKLMEVLYG